MNGKTANKTQENIRVKMITTSNNNNNNNNKGLINSVGEMKNSLEGISGKVTATV